MGHRTLNSILFAAALTFVAVSCEKEEETTTLPYLNGVLTVNVPEYVNIGQTITLTAKGLEHPDGEEIGYRWKVTPTMSQYDTTDVFSFTFTDTLQTCTIYCYGFADGYNSSSASYSSTVVKGGPEGSIQGTDMATFPVYEYKGISYHYMTSGDLQWFMTNLADGDAGGAPYKSYEAMSNVFGRYYSYEEALKACPQGWRLPTEEDWMALAGEFGAATEDKYQSIKGVASKLMANASFNGNLMWEYWPAVGEITNSSNLSLIPSGYANLGTVNEEGVYTYASFDGINRFAAVWTADMVEEEADMAYYRYLIVDQPDLLVGKGDRQSFGAAVRCVRDTSL